jgi:hypothetical protein
MELDTKPNCEYGRSCVKYGCEMFHPYGRRVGKDCRYGADCSGFKNGWCKFHHPRKDDDICPSTDEPNLKMIFSEYEFPPLKKAGAIEPAASPAKDLDNPVIFAKKPYMKQKKEYNERLWIYIASKGYTYKMIKHLGDNKNLDTNKLYLKLYGEYYRLYHRNKTPTPMPRKSLIDYDELKRKEEEMCGQTN